MFIDDEKYELLSNEANSIHLNVGIRLKSPFLPQVNTVLGGQIESLWYNNCGHHLISSIP